MTEPGSALAGPGMLPIKVAAGSAGSPAGWLLQQQREAAGATPYRPCRTNTTLECRP